MTGEDILGELMEKSSAGRGACWYMGGIHLKTESQKEALGFLDEKFLS